MLNKIIRNTRRWLERQGRIDRTRKELSLLSDRDLNDIGISRCDIDRVSKQSDRTLNVAL